MFYRLNSFIMSHFIIVISQQASNPFFYLPKPVFNLHVALVIVNLGPWIAIIQRDSTKESKTV